MYKIKCLNSDALDSHKKFRIEMTSKKSRGFGACVSIVRHINPSKVSFWAWDLVLSVPVVLAPLLVVNATHGLVRDPEPR